MIVEILIIFYVMSFLAVGMSSLEESSTLLRDEWAFWRWGRNPEETGAVAICRMSAVLLTAPGIILFVLGVALLPQAEDAWKWLTEKKEV